MFLLNEFAAGLFLLDPEYALDLSFFLLLGLLEGQYDVFKSLKADSICPAFVLYQEYIFHNFIKSRLNT